VLLEKRTDLFMEASSEEGTEWQTSFVLPPYFPRHVAQGKQDVFTNQICRLKIAELAT
jgi:hypothetical protein